MKIKNLLSFLLIALLTISCSSRDDEPIVTVEYSPLVKRINLGVFNPNAPSGDQFAYYFEYDSEEKLTKSIGGFIPLSGGTGYSGFFSNEIYTSLVYTNNMVTVEDFSSSSQFMVPKKSKYFKLNIASKIVEKEIPSQNIYSTKKQFFYYKDGNLDEIITTLPNMPYYPPDDYIETYSEKFFYDASKNLVRTEYYELRNGIREGEKIIRTFGNFDNSYNPFKRFTLLDEYFYRSLSKNNFRTYREERTYEYGGSNTSTQSWTFNYDASGNIILN